MHLVAVQDYVKLRNQYIANKRCKKPAMKASLAVAVRMGKSKFFARQIRQNERYLLRFKTLPPLKYGKRRGPPSLLDNEDVALSIRRYLASQGVGTIHPRALRKEVNDTILPLMGYPGTNICERTARTWLRRLGYSCQEARKGVYKDGHNRSDVIAARGRFLERMEYYERPVFRAF